ncbi:hypothetical protein ARAM_003151 [Aspergillus rambellii]|uniref:Asl1-like glycosyl hydrolase catalytic domain-containing protein n=3 Tax=Aspergillus subgen. Nidulantes TaxID=2720870 RepID=A0A0F8V2B2_9EURO|nr:hypothetical protein ARAM_003151 [Aspergillus rambellii]
MHQQHQSLEKRSSSKRGAAYNDAALVSSLSASGAVSWAYDWNMFNMGTLPSGVEYVPMLWGAKMFTGWVAAIETALASGSAYILGFNEPDLASQAAMGSAEAASYYRQYITPYSGQAKLVSPAVTSSTGTDVGLDWMNNFLTDCADCGISAMAVHWYGETADQFKSFVTQALQLASQHGLEETWVTEFALSSDLSGSGATSASSEFLNEVLPWMDAQSGITRYAAFMCAEGYLLSGNQLSVSGQAYTS